MAPVQMDHGPLSMGDATSTCACEYCAGVGRATEGGAFDCPVAECYKGRVAGFTETGNRLPDGGLEFEPLPVNAEQAAAVDWWLEYPLLRGSWVSPWERPRRVS